MKKTSLMAVFVVGMVRTLLAVDGGAIVVNVGTIQAPNDNEIFTFTATYPDGSTPSFTINCGGLAPGAQDENWASGSGTPSSVSIAGYPANWYYQGQGGVQSDVYGRQLYVFNFTYGTPPPPPPACTSNLCWSVVNMDTQYRVFAVGQSWGNGVPTIDYSDFVAPGAVFSYSITVPCTNAQYYGLYENVSGQDNLVPIAGAQGCNATNSPGQSGGMTANTVTNLPDVSSNEPPIVTVSPYTNTLPAVNPVNEGMIWPGNPQIPAHDEVIEAAGQQLNNTIWTAGAQSHSDDSAIVNAINTAGAQAHNDAGAVKGAIDTARQQNHSDLSQVLGAVVNLTNGIPKNPAMTNYATESTLESFQSLYGTNSAGLNGSVSNATAALTGLATSFSNLTDITNLDIASEGTLQGVTNLLTAINTNLLAVGTNLWSAFTNLAQQVTLVGISNLFGGNYSNSIVTDDLGVSNAFNTVFTLFDTNISTTNFSVTVSNEASYEQAAADSAAASPDLQGAETGLAGFLAQMSPVTVDDSWGEPDMTFDFGPFLSPAVGKIMSKGIADGSTVMDLNPMHNADLAAVFNAAKSLFAWLIAIIYLLKCARDAGKAIEMCELARGVVVTGPTTKKTYS